MKTLRFFLFCSLLSIHFFSFLALAATTAQKKLVVLGDSLTEGYGVAKEAAYPALLEKKLNADNKKSWTVVNAGVSGSTSASALSRIKWLSKSKPDLLILCLGANDGLRGLKPEVTKKNLAEAIEYAQKQKIKIVLGGLYMPPNYGAEYTKKFRQTFDDLAKKYQLRMVDFLLADVGGRSDLNLEDGIHPNEKGHQVIAENVYKVIKDLL